MDLSQYSDEQLAQLAGSPVSDAILNQESGKNSNSPTSIDGAIGQAQILPETFARYAKPGERIDSPADNLAVHNRIIADYSKKYAGDPERIATAYFSGEGNVAPSDSKTAWKNDFSDGNGKTVSSYVSDVLGRIGNSAIPNAKAEESVNSLDLSKYSDEDLAKLAGGDHANSTQSTNTDNAAKNQGQSQSGSVAIGSPIQRSDLDSSQIDSRVLADEPGYEYGGLLPFKKNTATGEKSFAFPEAIRSPIRGIQDLETLAENRSTETTPDAVNAMLALGTPTLSAKGSIKPQESPSITQFRQFLTDQSSGSPIPKLVVDNSGNFLKNNESGATLPAILQPEKPVPAALTTTDSGKPLLVTPKDVRQGQSDIQPFLQNDGLNLNKVADDLEAAQKVNPHVTALDVMAKEEGGISGGSNMVGLAKAIAQSPGQGKSLAAEMTGRGFTASQRVGETLNNNIAKSPYYNVQNDAIQQMDGSGKLYQQAYAANQNVSSPIINRLLKTDAGKQALSYAANRMNTKMSLMGIPDPELAQQAQLAGQYAGGGISNGLKLQTMQYVKEGYDNQISAAFNAGEKGKAGDLVEQKNGLLNELDKIDQQTTGGIYAKARQTYATGAKVKDAAENGRNFMSLDPEEIQSFMQDKGRSNPEKVAFAAGVRRAIQDKIDNQSETTNPINSLWKPALQKRLQPLFPDKQSFDQFAQSMEHEKTMARVNKIVQGSDTFEKINFNQSPQSTAKTALGNGIRAASDPLMFVGGHAADFVDKALTKQAQTLSQNSKTVIMRYLTTKDPALLRDLASRIGQQPETKAITK